MWILLKIRVWKNVNLVEKEKEKFEFCLKLGFEKMWIW